MSEIPRLLERLAAGLADEGQTLDLLGRRASVRAPDETRRQAAVLVLVSDTPDIVMLERSAGLRKHAGQIAFPGGAIDDTDVDAPAAALREAHEEVGLAPTSVQVLGALPPAFVAASRFDVTSVVAWWREPHPLVAGHPDEVASVHRLPVDALIDPCNRLTALHPSGYTGPAFELGDLFVWGFSAHVLSAVLDLAGWTKPWDVTRTSPVPARFLMDRRNPPKGWNYNPQPRS